MIRLFALLVVAVVLGGCGAMGTTKVPQTDITVGTTLSLANRTASVSLTSASCGVIGDGVITLNPGPAACFVAEKGASLVGQLSTAVGQPAK